MRKKYLKKPILDVDTTDLVIKESTLTRITLCKKEVEEFIEEYAKDAYFKAACEYLKEKHGIETSTLLIQEISEVKNKKGEVIGAEIIIDEVI